MQKIIDPYYSNINTAFNNQDALSVSIDHLKWPKNNRNTKDKNVIYYDNYVNYRNDDSILAIQASTNMQKKINICLFIILCIILLTVYWYYFIRNENTNMEVITKLNRKINLLM